MDKVTRMLLLYSRLVRGQPVNKIMFCMETECNERSFDRDIEDLRIYLSESYSTEDVVYDRLDKTYKLTGVTKQEVDLTVYRFLERILIKSDLLRKDELMDMLKVLASNTSNPKACQDKISFFIKDYPDNRNESLLKIHNDLVSVIYEQFIIEITYLDNDKIEKKILVAPYDLEFANGKIYLLAFEMNDSEDFTITYYSLDRIKSFEKKDNISQRLIKRMEERIEKRQTNPTDNVICVEMKCNGQFLKILKEHFKDSVSCSSGTGKVKVFTDEKTFVEWILGQSVGSYKIKKPIEIKRTISDRVSELYKEYGKEI